MKYTRLPSAVSRICCPWPSVRRCVLVLRFCVVRITKGFVNVGAKRLFMLLWNSVCSFEVPFPVCGLSTVVP